MRLSVLENKNISRRPPGEDNNKTVNKDGEQVKIWKS